ncbi:unnamed protein product [Periconia digitata]|uniref:Uncharacterized protein n=1 Tax=Periconia digitata TaxID=1303443 RepID=A0A9W4XF81_9PLEO|nr:unnamed protein product [Periconia digitata]
MTRSFAYAGSIPCQNTPEYGTISLRPTTSAFVGKNCCRLFLRETPIWASAKGCSPIPALAYCNKLM